MYTQSLILAVLPLMAHAVDIIQFAIWEDSVPNTECNLDLDGAYCKQCPPCWPSVGHLLILYINP